MRALSGKVAIVTGAARGQGLVEARMLAEAGAAVLLADILVEEGQAAAEALRSAGLDACFAHLDVTQPDHWSALMAQVQGQHARLDILVNNAGIVLRRGIAEMSLQDWNRVIAINLTGVFLGQQHAAPAMRGAGGGSIINIASNSAFSAHMDPAYTASKWGIRGLTRAAASEFAEWNIRANTICPGLVITDLNRNASHLGPMIAATPTGRAVEAEEVAGLVLFLASDAARSITGEDILIDGGFVNLSAYRNIRSGQD